MEILASRFYITPPSIVIAISLLAIALYIFIKKRPKTIIKTIFPTDTKYEAPYDPGDPSHQHDMEYQQYEVILRRGYTLAQHKAFTGFLTDYHVPYSAKLDYSIRWKDSITYFAREIDDDQLDTIRSDPGVLLVGRVPKIHMIR